MPSHGIINEIDAWWCVLMAPMASIARAKKRRENCSRDLLLTISFALATAAAAAAHRSWYCRSPCFNRLYVRALCFRLLHVDRCSFAKRKNNLMPMNNSSIVTNVNVIGVDIRTTKAKKKKKKKNLKRKEKRHEQKNRTEKCISNRVNLMTTKIKASNMHSTNEIKCVHCEARATQSFEKKKASSGSSNQHQPRTKDGSVFFSFPNRFNITIFLVFFLCSMLSSISLSNARIVEWMKWKNCAQNACIKNTIYSRWRNETKN